MGSEPEESSDSVELSPTNATQDAENSDKKS